MRFIGFDREEEAIRWAQAKIGEKATGLCRAVGIVDKDEHFITVAMMSNFTHNNVDVHIAADRVPAKSFLELFNFLFKYIFDHLRALRATALIRAANIKARAFVEDLGFKFEGLMRKAFNDDDLVIYGFLDDDFINHPWRRA